jgi:hypothetical protein
MAAMTFSIASIAIGANGKASSSLECRLVRCLSRLKISASLTFHFSELCAIIPFFQRSEPIMEQIPEPRRRLNVLTKAERRKRIFARLREGWAYDEIAREERVSAERIRQIVAEVLGKRVIDRGVDHAHLQLERLMPALRVVGEAIGRGELKAVAPLIKVIDRLDKHQETVVAKYDYGPEERQRLLDKVNRLVDNLQPLEPAAPTAEDADEKEDVENPS